MKRYVLTGAPGCGKTTILGAMAARGWAIVAEAATDVIAAAQAAGNAHPERSARFIDDIVGLQKRRQIEGAQDREEVQLFDRSPICTWALAVYLGYPISAALRAEVDRLEKDRMGVFRRQPRLLRADGRSADQLRRPPGLRGAA